MTDWYRNDDPLEALSIDDRAIHYGDGLFETVAIRAGEPRLWHLHTQRLLHGCARLGITAPDETTLRASLDHAIRHSGVDAAHAVAKIIVSAGVGPRGYRRPTPMACEPLIGIFSAEPLSRRCYEQGVAVVKCETRLSNQPRLAGLKTLNRLEQVLARNEWQDPNIFEGLMCDSEERIICGTMSNVFIISDNSISTPELSRNGVAGVMRRHVLDTLEKSGISVREDKLSQRVVLSADALFLSNTQFGVLPVKRFNDFHFTGSDLFHEVSDLLELSGIAECRR